VRVYNDSVSGGKAMGKWWLETGSAAGKVVDGGEGTTTSTDIVCSVVRTTATGVRRFLTITPFADWREGGGSAKTMHSLDFDMEMFSNCPTRPTQAAVLYAWNDYQKDGCLPAVRILGGGLLPETGLTFATRLPLYVRGNFNSSGQTRPALLCGDAVSLLSAAWDDANSWSGIAGRAAVDTTVKTTVITGDLPLNAAGDAGGFVDILRLCENWTGKTLTYRGAVACLWRSQMALGMTTPGGNTFLRPNWDWAYDAMYRQPASEPPGEPWVVGLESLLWAQDSWSQDEIPQPKSTN
jgi:hypothetical protein